MKKLIEKYKYNIIVIKLLDMIINLETVGINLLKLHPFECT